MAIVRRRRHLAWAVVDPIEIRSTGETTAPRRRLGGAIGRLVLAEKPTAIVAGRGVGAAARAAGKRRPVPVVDAPPRLVAAAAATDLYPEFPIFAPTPLFALAARLAISTLLTNSFPTRLYAPRERPPVRSRARTLRRRRNADGPDACAARVPR